MYEKGTRVRGSLAVAVDGQVNRSTVSRWAKLRIVSDLSQNKNSPQHRRARQRPREACTMNRTIGFAAQSATTPLESWSFERREPGSRDVTYRFVIDMASLR